jgi:DNA-binding HxlR family transcriptional regulator
LWCSMEKMTDSPACRDATSLSVPPPEIDATLSVLGGKWKLLILWQLLRRPCRFNELRRAITGVSQHMLTVQLRDLESQGVITRTIFAGVPPRVEYALSEHGKSLGGVMRALAEWGESHLARQHG